MPMHSEQQRKAMHAAVKGRSTIGIPKKVAKEFVAADPGGKLPKQVSKSPIGPSNPVQREQLRQAIAGAIKRRK